MTRVLTVLPAVPVPATAGLQLRMIEVLQIVRALGCHSTVLAFETEDGDPGHRAVEHSLRRSGRGRATGSLRHLLGG